MHAIQTPTNKRTNTPFALKICSVALTFTIANESSSAPQQQQQPFNLLLQLRSVNGAARL
jgi:hypothetical protein